MHVPTSWFPADFALYEYKTRCDKTRQDKTRHDKPRQDKARQDKTRQDRTGQDKTRQDKKTRQARHEHFYVFKMTTRKTWKVFVFVFYRTVQ